MRIGAAGAANGFGPYQMYNMMTNHAGNAGGSAGGAGAVKGAGGADGVAQGECKTCAERRYVDGSNDAGVSFKTPTRVAPQAAASAVMSHEQEHVSRERSKADAEDRKVVSQGVQIHMAVCPECGKAYVSGGTTTTVTAADRDRQKAQEPGKGQKFDAIA